MSLNDDAPIFFVAGLQGTAGEGPNVILSFATPIPSPDHASRTYRTNVRIVMSTSSLDQMLEFLAKAKANPASGANMHPMPETKQ